LSQSIFVTPHIVRSSPDGFQRLHGCPNALTELASSLVDLVIPFVGGSLMRE
jgi:hypothetical protein